MLKKLGMIMLVVVLLVTISGCTAKEEAIEEKSEVVAKVNDKEILRIDFEYMVENMKLSYQQYGIDFKSEENKGLLALVEQEAINNLIQQELILQDALEKGYEVAKEDIEYEIEQIKAQFDTEEEYLKVLEANQITLAQLEKTIAKEIIIQLYIQNEIGESTVTEDEVLAMYEEYIAAIEEVPPFEEIRLELEEELKYEKFQVKFIELIDKLELESSIEILL